jgi:hypothetical protein
VGFVVEKVVLGQVFSEYFGFPCQSSFHQLLHNHHHLSSGACIIGQFHPTKKENSQERQVKEEIVTQNGIPFWPNSVMNEANKAVF